MYQFLLIGVCLSIDVVNPNLESVINAQVNINSNSTKLLILYTYESCENGISKYRERNYVGKYSKSHTLDFNIDIDTYNALQSCYYICNFDDAAYVDTKINTKSISTSQKSGPDEVQTNWILVGMFVVFMSCLICVCWRLLSKNKEDM